MIDWLNMTVKEAAEKIAEIAADRRTYPEKRAEGSGLLSGIGGFLQQNPTAAHALMGGALGAGATGIGTALGNSGKPEDERRSVLSSMLGGAAGGAALGGGLSMAGSALGEIRNGMPHHDAIPHGQFKDPSSGRQMTVPPEVLRQHPELADRVRQLTQPQGIMDRAWGGVQSLWEGATNLAPVSSRALPVAAGLDVAMRNRGETMGFGHVRPSHTNNPDAFRAGISGVPGVKEKIVEDVVNGERTGVGSNSTRAVPGAADGADLATAVQQRLGQQPPPANWRERLSQLTGRGRENANESVLDITHRPRAASKDRELINPENPALWRERPGEVRLDPRTESLGRGAARQANRAGHAALEGLDGHSTPRSLFRMFGHDIPVHRAIPAIGGRALFYGGLPILENAVRSGLTGHNREQELRDLMMRYARPVPQQGGPQ